MRRRSLELCQDRRADTAILLLKPGLEQLESVWPWRAWKHLRQSQQPNPWLAFHVTY